MAGKRRKPIEIVETGESLRGNRLIKPINHLIDKLHDVGTERDHAGNRKLFFDQYATLLLLDFLTPSLDSLRALREATGWEKSRRKLDPRKLVERRRDRLVFKPSTDGCGCCPICHEFVDAEFTEPGGLAACPRCGGLIDELDPLGITSS
jgi:hypothetical protein